MDWKKIIIEVLKIAIAILTGAGGASLLHQ